MELEISEVLGFCLELEDFPAALNVADELQEEGPHRRLRIYTELLRQRSHGLFYDRTLFVFYIFQKALHFRAVGNARYHPVGVHHGSFGKTIDVSYEALTLKVDFLQDAADIIS